MPAIKHVHLIAICGTGMGSLAGMLKASGYHVSGSDQNVYPPMSTWLAEQGIVPYSGFAPEHLEGADLVIVGNAVSKANPEVVAMLERGLPYRSFPQALAEFFIRDRHSMVVAGTHGKTTTTALLAWVLTSAGRDPGAMIGGWAKNFDGNFRVGGGGVVAVEGDEYDTAFFDKGPKFLHYRPRTAILTSIEFDHADIYRDLAHVVSAFERFVELIPRDGLLVAAAGEETVARVAGRAASRVETYGFAAGSDWSAEGLSAREGGVSFDVRYAGARFGRFDLPLIGRHNVLNALAVIAAAHGAGLDAREIAEGFRTFRGIKRRQDVVGVANDVVVMDDFAHHPTAIRETLAAVKMGYPSRQLWAIFEPRSATSRRAVFQTQFAEAFDLADRVVIAEPFASEKLPVEQRLDAKRLVDDLGRRGVHAAHLANADDIVRTVAPQLAPGDVICVMSSGGFDGIHAKLLAALRAAEVRSLRPPKSA
ncbi:MAG TPA: UDP-N-acetylmuramate:L-alanyl-gamma-D-glutamyl-meso-diaminopimelate ligase [Nitrospiria bacterium]|nr:UDP-N-acetylmuramate:L-alanyl-gamma-D-glutamyl-meso-diaminopimelate ligase [Nitrospiria bacterium]